MPVIIGLLVAIATYSLLSIFVVIVLLAISAYMTAATGSNGNAKLNSGWPLLIASLSIGAIVTLLLL